MEDLTKKENQTFKNWWKIMWSNGYIFIFFIAIATIMLMLSIQYDETWHQVFMLIPILVLIAVTYKGFIQMWNDLCNGRSR